MTTRYRDCLALIAVTVLLVFVLPRSSAQSPDANEVDQMSNQKLLETLVGRWSGTCRTWFEPGKLADESEISGEFEVVLDGDFVRHSYRSTITGKPRRGEELLAVNAVTGAFQSSWIDDFHMNYAIMFSQGERTPEGFIVRGQYDVGEDQPPWGWRTEYALAGDDQLSITSFNVTPAGTQAKAIEIIYRRVD